MPGPYPVSLWQAGDQWGLDVHGLDGLSLVATDAEAKHRAAQLLSQALGQAVSPTDVRLVHREHPATTLARMDCHPVWSVSQCLDAGRPPTPTTP